MEVEVCPYRCMERMHFWVNILIVLYMVGFGTAQLGEWRLNQSINCVEVINTSCSDSTAERDYRYWVDSSCVHTAASGICMYHVHTGAVLGKALGGSSQV